MIDEYYNTLKENDDMTVSDHVKQDYEHKEVIFGDGSFDDCVRIASILDGSYVLDEKRPDQMMQIANALVSSLIPQSVIEYAASCENTYLRTVMFHNRLLSDGFAAQFLRKQLMSNEVPGQLHRSLISNSQFLNGMKDFLRFHKMGRSFDVLYDKSEHGVHSHKEQ